MQIVADLAFVFGWTEKDINELYFSELETWRNLAAERLKNYGLR